MVEEKADHILSQAHLSHVAFLVVGDPFVYVCYFSYIYINILIVLLQFLILVVRAKKMGIQVNIVHNASVIGAILWIYSLSL